MLSSEVFRLQPDAIVAQLYGLFVFIPLQLPPQSTMVLVTIFSPALESQLIRMPSAKEPKTMDPT